MPLKPETLKLPKGRGVRKLGAHCEPGKIRIQQQQVRMLRRANGSLLVRRPDSRTGGSLGMCVKACQSQILQLLQLSRPCKTSKSEATPTASQSQTENLNPKRSTPNPET